MNDIYIYMYECTYVYHQWSMVCRMSEEEPIMAVGGVENGAPRRVPLAAIEDNEHVARLDMLRGIQNTK